MEPKGILSFFNKNRHLIGLFLFVVFFLLFVFYIFQQKSKFEPRPQQTNIRIEDQKLKLPNFQWYDEKGKSTNLYDYQGSVVLLSYWASWCTPCHIELPMFEKLKQKFRRQNFVILPINLDDEKEDALAFIKRFWPQHKISFTSYFDQDKETAMSLGVLGLPTNYLIDKNSQIVFESTGLHDWLDEEIVLKIEELLNQ